MSFEDGEALSGLPVPDPQGVVTRPRENAPVGQRLHAQDAIDMLCPGSLYPRVFTEGLFGIIPTGLASFECTPWLPKAWPRMALRDLRAFGRSWDLLVERDGDQQKVTVTSGGKTVLSATGPAGKTYSVTFR